MRLWVVPCRYDPVVHDCTEAIRSHFPDDKILLVDSCSPDQSYTDRLDVDHVELGNTDYAIGAWDRALDYPADDYALIHDSLIVQSHWQPPEFQTVRWFHENMPPADQAPFVCAALDRMGVPLSTPYHGMFGPLLFCSRPILEHLAAFGLLDSRPTNNVEASCMERICGIVAEHLGYPVTKSLQGQQYGLGDPYDEAKVRKVYRDRP